MLYPFFLYKILGSGKDHFILKVKADSMIGADIDNGDLVVLEVRQTAKNREIVAVVIGVIKKESCGQIL